MPKQKSERTNSSEALYQLLKKEIERGHWKLGERMPTIDQIEKGEIADLKSTRHNARIAFNRLAREGLVKPQGKLGTIVIKSSPALGRPRLIALITPAPSEFVSRLTTAIADALQSKSFGREVSERYRLVSMTAGGKIALELQLLKELAQEVDVLLILPTPANDDNEHNERVGLLCGIDKPKWLIAASINDGPMRYPGEVIAYPESTIAKRITEFVRKDLPRPTHVFVVGEDHLEALRERAACISHSLTKELELDVTPLTPSSTFSGGPEDLGKEFAEKIVDKEFAEKIVKQTGDWAISPPRVLVVCTTDLVAFGVLDGFRRKQFAVPEQAMVMGVDDQKFAKYCNPQLTSLELKPEVLGRAVVERIVARLDDAQSVLAPVDLNSAVGEITNRKSTWGLIS